MPVLFQIGLLQVEVEPFNFDEHTIKTGADLVAKEIIGAPKPREFTGEADTDLSFRGRLFPQVLGGLDELDLCESMSQSGDPQMVVRGDGKVLGWFFVQELEAKHSTLDAQGVGREISVDVKLVKSPRAASPQSMLSTILGLFA